MGREFDSRLSRGRVAESAIADWLIRRGHSVLPAYDVGGASKGPRVFGPGRALVAPDFLAFPPDDAEGPMWVEAKSKATFTYHRATGSFQDGIDAEYWQDYQELAARTGWPVWLLFLHAPGQSAKDNPPGKTPPTGLFGGEASRLVACVDHVSDKCGRGGMVYWRVSDLAIRGGPLASWEDVTGVVKSNGQRLCSRG